MQSLIAGIVLKRWAGSNDLIQTVAELMRRGPQLCLAQGFSLGFIALDAAPGCGDHGMFAVEGIDGRARLRVEGGAVPQARFVGAGGMCIIPWLLKSIMTLLGSSGRKVT